MLQNTFCHLPGVGARVERGLWKKGLLSWDSFTASPLVPGTPRFATLREHLRESAERLKDDDPRYFATLLPAPEMWRLFAEFRHSVAYLDIETNGLNGTRAYITAITLYDGVEVKCYVKGKNLIEFKKDIRNYKVIVTYNGRCFDVPFIERHMRMKLAHAHIDLRFLLKDLGITGGLKGCEKKLGIDRGELDGVDGYFAVLLWYDYKRNNNPRALETLLAYNVADVVNLEPLMVIAYNMKLKGTPFESTHALVAPEPPEVPYKADMPTIRRIKERYSRRYAAY